jgi:hypothetical protein
MTKYDEYGMPVGATYPDPESLTTQASRLARAFYVYRVRPLAEKRYNELRTRRWSFRRLFTLVNVLVVVWWVVVYWGERRVFSSAVESCNWDSWEKWVLPLCRPKLDDTHG